VCVDEVGPLAVIMHALGPRDLPRPRTSPVLQGWKSKLNLRTLPPAALILLSNRSPRASYDVQETNHSDLDKASEPKTDHDRTLYNVL
jgi:hypothetical protein